MHLQLLHIKHGIGLAITLLVIAIVFVTLAVVEGDKVGSCGNTALQGIDVSHHQKEIDWAAVAAEGKIAFAYIKATEGATHRDTKYSYNITEAHKAGIAVGSYHYFLPRVPVKKQLHNFMSLVKKYPQDLIPAIDIEQTNDFTAKQICDSVELFATLIEEHCGCKPLIYTHQRFYNEYLQLSFAEYPLWIARYGFFIVKPRPQLEDNRDCTVWQYSNRGHIEGIKDFVDINTIGEGYTLHHLTMQ